MMSADWAVGMCNAWNAEQSLTEGLVESGWVKNDKGRGFKAMQVYRADCPSSPRIELRVSEKGGKAMFFQRLQFAGPKLEAMGNMGPFASFLLLVGKVQGQATTCPRG